MPVIPSTTTFWETVARKASPAAIEIIRLGYLDLWGDGIDTISALMMLRDEAVSVLGHPAGLQWMAANLRERLLQAAGTMRALPDLAAGDVGQPEQMIETGRPLIWSKGLFDGVERVEDAPAVPLPNREPRRVSELLAGRL